MIEKILMTHDLLNYNGEIVAAKIRDKLNELIEASNRQDRAIARMMGQHYRNGITQQISNDIAYFAEVGKEISTGIGT